MKLRTRLVFLFLFLAWAPLGAAIWQLTENVADDYRERFQDKRNAVSRAIDARFALMSAHLVEALEKNATHRTLLSELVGPMSIDAFYGSGDPERNVRKVARDVLSSPALDTFALVDLKRKGHVIAAGHHDELALAVNAGVVERVADDDTLPFFQEELLRDLAEGRPIRTWTFQVIRPLSKQVVMVGGKRMDARLVRELLVGLGVGGVAVQVTMGDRVIAADFEGDQPAWDHGFERTDLIIGGTSERGARPVWHVFVDKGELHAANSQLHRLGLLLAALGGLGALLLGLWLAGRMSRPLEELAEAAGEVAGGARDRQVKERGGRDEMSVLVRSFNTMTRELAAGEERLRQSERVAAWREIAKRIAHEIKNPLTPIQLNIEMLRRRFAQDPERFGPQLQEVMDATLEEVGRVKRIVDEFSRFARMPAPKMTQVDLGELVDSSVALYREGAGDVEIRRLGDPSVVLSLDPDQVRQVLTNLLKNAMEALDGGRTGQETPWIELTLTTHADHVILSVADNGPGISDEAMNQLFTPYFTTKAGGTGLGLAIVHRIAHEHGGTITVTRAKPQGCVFSVTLPLGEDAKGG